MEVEVELVSPSLLVAVVVEEEEFVRAGDCPRC